MRISMWVPYDEGRLRRTLAFLSRSQLGIIRVLGGVILVLGIFLVMLDSASPIAYVLVAAGLLFLFGMAPLTTAWSVRMQAEAIKSGYHLTLDEEWVTMAAPLVESRLRWAGVDRVVETPEVWYAMFGKLQAVAIPKDLMTEPDRAAFAAFVAQLPAGGPPKDGNIDRSGEST